MCLYRATLLPAVLITVSLLTGVILPSTASPLHAELDRRAVAIEDKVIAWRRDFHQHPELAYREFRTANIIAQHLERLNFDQVQTGVAHTGVVGILEGGRPGPVVALRAEMDAYLGAEKLALPFASKVTATHKGQTVGISHAALNHDAHVAMLMGAAEVLARMREQLAGTIKVIFQPAEEVSLLPSGEKGGAQLMTEEGVLENPRPNVIFSLHSTTDLSRGIGYRHGGMFASSGALNIILKGKQTYGAYPWQGQDPITTAAQIILALQTIPSRQLDITKAPALISIGKIHAGELKNVIPGELKMAGIIRTLDPAMEQEIYRRVESTVTRIAESAGIVAEISIKQEFPVLYNDPTFTDEVMPSLQRIFSEIKTMPPTLGSQQFSFFSQKIPSFYFFLGLGKENSEIDTDLNEKGMIQGVRALASLAFDYQLKHSTD